MEVKMKNRLLFVFSALAFLYVLVFTGCLLLTTNTDDDNSDNGLELESEEKYIVSFNLYGGSPIEPIEIAESDVINPLPAPVRGGYIFEGWFTDKKTFQESFTSSMPVTGNINLYAKWSENPVYANGVLPAGTLNEKFTVIADRADENIIYTILIGEDTECEYWDIVTRGINMVIDIQSANPQAPKKLSSKEAGALFSINNNITIKLRDIIIQENPNDTNSMIIVNGGTLEVLGGAKITGNHIDGSGAGVIVSANGNLILDGGEIYGNSSTSWGGGVLVNKGGTIYHEKRFDTPQHCGYGREYMEYSLERRRWGGTRKIHHDRWRNLRQHCGCGRRC
jgi:uncharacterized repeat protein (TIGR02543 family)